MKSSKTGQHHTVSEPTRGQRLPLPALLCVWALAVAAIACAPMPEGPPQVGDLAPDFSAPTLDGDTVSLASLRGSVVMLNVWATWCTPCRWETPFLQSLHEAHFSDGLRLVGLSVDAAGAGDDVRTFVEESGVDYQILLDPTGSVMDRYGVLGLPASFIIDREGTIRFLRYGPIAENDPSFIESLESILSLGPDTMGEDPEG